jgi:hypothetical protein
MILEEETFEAFEYYPRDLKPQSNKHILVYCDFCGEIRVLIRAEYHYFCRSCSMILGEKNKGEKHYNFKKHLSTEIRAKLSAANKGKTLTEERKANLSMIQKGKKNPNYKGGKIKCTCSTCGKEFTVYPSYIKGGGGKYCSIICMGIAERGEKNSRYNGGTKVARLRSHAKRRQQLGYTLLMPLADGEVGHHVTDEYVIGIPKEMHQSFGGRSRKKHRALVLQWLKANDTIKYEMVIKVL